MAGLDSSIKMLASASVSASNITRPRSVDNFIYNFCLLIANKGTGLAGSIENKKTAIVPVISGLLRACDLVASGEKTG